jgi:hypothetical protein
VPRQNRQSASLTAFRNFGNDRSERRRFNALNFSFWRSAMGTSVGDGTNVPSQSGASQSCVTMDAVLASVSIPPKLVRIAIKSLAASSGPTSGALAPRPPLIRSPASDSRRSCWVTTDTGIRTALATARTRFPGVIASAQPLAISFYHKWELTAASGRQAYTPVRRPSSGV